MKILISNDDGVLAPGITSLMQQLRTIGKVTVVAPDRDRSGASNSLTLDQPLRSRQLAADLYAVDGTPTDCVHLAITGLLAEDPDIVVSGINAGANLGDDTLYSGTVAAAMEGRFLGYPAIAISLAALPDTPRGTPFVHYDSAAAIAIQLLAKLSDHPLPAQTILNVNVPDLPLSEIKGFAATRLGFRHRAEAVVATTDPRGRPIYWVGPSGEEQDAGPGTDFYAIRQQQISVTPLMVDLTRHNLIDSLQGWLSN
ncbi:MAG: 5'/3'-nucleotidase SurE [Gammaproteobacteria bacterium]|nr:5'/3'-nucleotidase SurE [Gammaproteobacteria bacterium]